MATAKQIAANRKNAQKSCGPKSAETKAKVSQNAWKHGLCAHFRVLEEIEHQESYDAFLNQLMQDEQPVGQAEIELVVKMAEHTWLAKRALRMQNHCFIPQPQTPEQKKSGDVALGIATELEVCLRYHTSHDRAYQRASAELQKRKEKRRLAEIGFVRQQCAQAEDNRKTEKHAVTMAIANLRKQREEIRKQREEIKLGSDLARILPPDFDLSTLDSNRFAAAAHTAPPMLNR